MLSDHYGWWLSLLSLVLLVGLYVGFQGHDEAPPNPTPKALKELARAHQRTSERVAELSRNLQRLYGRLQELERAAEKLRSSRSLVPNSPAAEPGLKELWQEIAQLRNELAEVSSSRPLPQAFLQQAIRPVGTEPQLTKPVTSSGSNPGELQWGIAQLLGPPDTMTDGDLATAWASQQPDGGTEWIEVDFDRTVRPSSVLIRETFNPGAVVRVEALDANSRFHTIWSGTDPTQQSPGDFVLPYDASFATQTLRISLDTSLVAGWNEIDAIGIIEGGRTHWAAAADASSTYASNYNR